MARKFKGKYLRRTGRKRNKSRRRKFKSFRRRKTASRRYQISTLPRKTGRFTRQNELKYRDYVIPDGTPVNFAFSADPDPVLTQLGISTFQDFPFTQGTGKAQFIGKRINLVQLEYKFTVEINPEAYPNTNDLVVAFNGSLRNYQPRIRVTTLWNKFEGGNAVPNVLQNAPLFVLNGFMAPWDINIFRIVEDKIFSLAAYPTNTWQNVNSGWIYSNGRFRKTFIKRLPLRMTVNMTDPDPDGNCFIDYPFYHYVTLTHDAPYDPVAPHPFINVNDQFARIWFKDP